MFKLENDKLEDGRNEVLIFEFEVWNLFEICDLIIGISNMSFVI
jgi:hypothetical protein